MAVEQVGQEPRAGVPAFDHARAEAAVRELLIAVGEDPEREGLLQTPARVARAYAELLSQLVADEVLAAVATIEREVSGLGPTTS